MPTPEKTEREYVEATAGLMRQGAFSGVLRRPFLIGVLHGLLWVWVAGNVLLAYVRLGGAVDNWHFVFGFAVGLLLVPGIFVLGISLARMMTDISSRESRPYTLMVKYRDHLVREGLDPYEEPKQ